MDKIIDLRSDTVTHPTPAMREAMAHAEVGDDVYGEDPTVNRLEEMAAERMGKEAGLFVASGTMGNLIAVLVHCQRGEEAIMGHLGHTFLFEAGGVSALGGVFVNTLPNQPDGSIALSDLENAIRGADIHQPISRLIILENTHNRCGGTVLDGEYTRQVGEFAHRHGVRLHLDGARIFNAAAALRVPVSDLTKSVDSVTFCLSKGLCAPVGSVLCGSKEFIAKARRVRKMLGGGMRQAGVLAAAGIVALEQIATRLEEDHRRARRLAEGLFQIPALKPAYGMPQTNMVFVSLREEVAKTAKEVAEELFQRGIRVGVTAPRTFRLVLHYWINDEDVEQTIRAFADVLR
ncbi:MAG: low-specificity L-threonine aldolase [Chloroflexota bacterium]